MNAIILAGGKGTRMKVISDMPKVLLPINHKPIIEHAINKLLDCGVKKIFITLASEATELESWIKESSFSAWIEIVKDVPAARGNSYGIIQAMKNTNQTTILAYGDTIFKFPVSEMLHSHIEDLNDISVLVRDTDHPSDSDLAWSENGTVKFSKYPHDFSNFAGKLGVSAFYIISPRVLDQINHEDFSDWFRVVEHLNQGGKKVGLFRLKQGFIKDLGTPDRYYRFIKEQKNDNL